ncbi:MAG: phosphoribosylanthranilate isomerase [Prevotella sp.]
MIIKICGMREPDNIRAAAQTGIDWMGMIFWPRSSRYVDDLSAADAIPEGIVRVGVFVDQPVPSILDIAARCRLNVIQLHGNESAESITELKALLPKDVKQMKAISISSAEDMKKAAYYAEIVDYLLFDTKCQTVGGSGKQFDWSIIDDYEGPLPFLLSGGIGPDDVEAVSTFQHPLMMGIDLNSKFETAPAHKDVGRISTFVGKLKIKN